MAAPSKKKEGGNRKNTHANKAIQKSTKIAEGHRAVIDEYFCNGFNGVQAVLSVWPDKPYQQARNLATAILQSDRNKQYIEQRQAEQGQRAAIQAEQLINELKGQAFSDLRHYLGLTLEEIKALPPELTRPLKKVTHRRKVYRNKDGSQVEDTTISYELEDRQRALDMLARHLGLYNADQSHKAQSINIERLNIDQLNALLTAVQPSDPHPKS